MKYPLGVIIVIFVVRMKPISYFLGNLYETYETGFKPPVSEMPGNYEGIILCGCLSSVLSLVCRKALCTHICFNVVFENALICRMVSGIRGPNRVG